VVAVLPNFGNQLFYYTLYGDSLQLLGEMELVHPERNDKIAFDVEKDDWSLYSSFGRLHGGGEYFLIEFNTPFPRSVLRLISCKGRKLPYGSRLSGGTEKIRTDEVYTHRYPRKPGGSFRAPRFRDSSFAGCG